jgi:hypothetical protein
VLAHGDFAHGNVLVDEAEITAALNDIALVGV